MYELEDGGVTITGYVEEPEGGLVFPEELNGYPVTGIGDNAFADAVVGQSIIFIMDLRPRPVCRRSDRRLAFTSADDLDAQMIDCHGNTLLSSKYGIGFSWKDSRFVV
jgi:hypothetical protein